MPQYNDHAHPPNADYRGEEPSTGIDVGPEGISVTLDTWGPQENLFATLYDTVTATWGEVPMRSGNQTCKCVVEDVPARFGAGWGNAWEHRTGWCRLNKRQRAALDNAFKGGSLQQDLEGISFYFTITGVTRAFTHEFVRTRLGAAFKQQGGRDNDWRHHRWTMTEAMERVCYVDEDRRRGEGDDTNGGKHHCITDWKPLDDYVVRDDLNGSQTLRQAIEKYLDDGKRLYSALVDAGVAWQDARRVLPIGTQTYIHGIYNYVGLRGVLANRLEYIMDWEINCVAQLMLREIKMKCPPLISRYLGSHSDLAGKAMFDQLELCPPDGKYPSTTIRCKTCGHAEANHRKYNYEVEHNPLVQRLPDEMLCEVCERSEGHPASPAPLHRFVPIDTLPRVFRREQQPFFVLHPDSMNGGPVKWLWTNGHYHDIDSQLQENINATDANAKTRR